MKGSEKYKCFCDLFVVMIKRVKEIIIGNDKFLS